jgi:uncharacterized membrane-anchored protein
MLRIVSLLFGVPVSVAGLVFASRALSLGLIELLLSAFIIGFAVAATGWTIRRNV